MTYRNMTEADILSIVPLYIGHYNTYEDGAWTNETAYKRIHQVWSHEDALCLIAEDNGQVLGFAMGHFEQYDDLKAYDLVEVVISHDHQNCGLGTAFISQIETQVKNHGGAMIQLQSVNDAMHNHFYGKLGYQNCTNLVLKSKFL